MFWLSTFSERPLSASELPCPPWPDSAPQEIQPTEIPAPLQQILLYHRGHGFAATFVQEKKVLLLRRPLRSSGHVIFLPQQVLYRQLTSPFQQELLITTTAVHQRDARGWVKTMSLAKLPSATVLVEGFLTLFSGSWESLQRHFQVYFVAADPLWRLGLLPKHAMMSQVISCLIFEGQFHHMRSLWIHESNGDLTHDSFTDLRLLTPEQWDDYRKYFDWGR